MSFKLGPVELCWHDCPRKCEGWFRGHGTWDMGRGVMGWARAESREQEQRERAESREVMGDAVMRDLEP